MFIGLMKSINATLQVGDQFYLKQGGSYVTFDSNDYAQYGSKAESKLFTVKKHQKGGFTFETGNKALNYSGSTGKLCLYGKGDTKPNNNFYVLEAGQGKIKLKSDTRTTCAKKTGTLIKFGDCKATDNSILFDVENTTRPPSTPKPASSSTPNPPKSPKPQSAYLSRNETNLEKNMEDPKVERQSDGSKKTTMNGSTNATSKMSKINK